MALLMSSSTLRGHDTRAVSGSTPASNTPVIALIIKLSLVEGGKALGKDQLADNHRVILVRVYPLSCWRPGALSGTWLWLPWLILDLSQAAIHDDSLVGGSCQNISHNRRFLG